MTEKQPIDHNVMPRFEMIPPRIHPLQFAGRALHAIASFITEYHTIPYSQHAQETHKVDEMLLDEPGTPYTYPEG